MRSARSATSAMREVLLPVGVLGPNELAVGHGRHLPGLRVLLRRGLADLDRHAREEATRRRASVSLTGGGPGLHDGQVTDPDLGRLLLETYRLLAAEITEAMDERGYPDVKAAHAAVFTNIDRRSGTRLTDLARRARMTKQGMMLLIDELESRGYVRRVPDPEDARAKVVRLPAHGRRCAAEARRVVAGVESRARRDLGIRRYATMREALEMLTGVSDGSSAE